MTYLTIAACLWLATGLLSFCWLAVNPEWRTWGWLVGCVLSGPLLLIVGSRGRM